MATLKPSKTAAFFTKIRLHMHTITEVAAAERKACYNSSQPKCNHAKEPKVLIDLATQFKTEKNLG